MLTKYRTLTLIAAYAACLIPLTTYVTDLSSIQLMVFINLLAYIGVLLTTADIAQGILTSEKQKTPAPRWLKTPKLQTWWAIVRRSRKWHLALVIPKLGLALAFVHFFHYGAGSVLYDFDDLWRSYQYVSHGGGQDIPIENIYPQWETIGISIPFLTLFTLFEGGLLSGLYLFTKQKFSFVVTRVLIGVFSVYIVAVIPQPSFLSFWQSIYSIERRDSMFFEARVRETAFTSVMTLHHQGVLISANIMRPIGDGTRWAGVEQCGTRMIGDIEHYKYCYDNRLFVLRQVVAGILGLLLYAAVTAGVLRLAEDPEPAHAWNEAQERT